MTAPTESAPRFVVRELGPRSFAVEDTVSHLSYDMRFTRKFAQEAADRRNERASITPEPLAEPRRYDWDETPQEAAHWDRRWFNRDED